jgi:hypothetical protein
LTVTVDFPTPPLPLATATANRAGDDWTATREA